MENRQSIQNKTLVVVKRTIMLFALCVVCFCASAQSITVKSFKALPMDMTASSLEGKRIDQNGQVAALIKVVTTQTGFTFEGGTLGIVDSKQTSGEVWVWVPRAARKITIKHQEFGVLRDYYYPVEIEAERTYEMVIITEKAGSGNKPGLRQQYLAFQITPPNATLEVNDQAWEVGSDGTAMKFVNFGTYTWRVQAPDYHPDAGKITVNDPNNTQIVSVDLLPNFGWIEISGEGLLEGASVYIDKAYVGKAPFKSEAISSGQHIVRVSKERYEAYTEMVTVKDSETTKISPVLNAGFAEVTLEVDADAEIWVNNERKGFRTWTGILGKGTNLIHCKQENHEQSFTQLEIDASMNGQTITLPSPYPIYGSLNVESTPAFASIFIDGKPMGETPKFVPELLVGQHELRLTKEGYVTRTESITIVKGERSQVQVKLGKSNDGHDVSVTPKENQPVVEQPKESENPANTTSDKVEPKQQKKQKAEKPEKPKAENVWESKFFGTLNFAYSAAPQMSYGISVGQVKRFGWFVSVMTNGSFKGMSPAGNCDAEGYFEDGSLPLYTGEAAKDRLSVIAGGMIGFTDMLYARVGVGYGVRNLCWQDVNGQYYRNMGYSVSGLDLSAGLQMHFGKVVLSLEGVTTNFKTLEGKVGLGMVF